MGYQINPGNLLPIYEKEQWRRHLWEGCDNEPYGIPFTNVRSMPFQFPTDESIAGTTTIYLYREDGTLVYAFGTYESFCTSGKNYIIYKGGYMPSPVDAGYYYYEIHLSGGKIYYSDYIHHMPISAAENVNVTILSCSDVGGGRADFSLTANDYIGCAIVSQTIEHYTGGSWVLLGSGSGNLVTVDLTNTLRRVVTLENGYILTTYFTITWDGAHCLAATLTVDSRENTDGTAGYWKVAGTNTNDKDGIIYQTGYTQEIWVRPTFAPIEIVRTESPDVDGEGNEVIGNARTVEKWKFEAPSLPDYVLFPLTIFRDLDTVTLTGVTIDDEITMTNYDFDNDLDGACLNVGLFSFDNAIEVFSGCDEDKSSITCV